MSRVLLIARREIAGYLATPLGALIMAALLVLNGLAFNAVAMSSERPSFDVLERFFFLTCGFVAAAGILFSMRLFAEERQQGTITLLFSAPAREVELVLGKFVGALGFLALFLALTSYMPLLILVNGRVSGGHLVVGYLGLLFEGAAVIAIGTLMSALTKSQLLAAVMTAVVVVALFVCWMLAGVVEGDLGPVVGYLDFYDKHYRSFSRGVVKLSSLVYYGSLAVAGLLAATRVLEARRWRG